MTYADKLKDPRWQRKRLEILERDQFKCRDCKSEGKTLHVHHRIYRKGKSPWDYEDDVFVTLCEGCHQKAELLKERILMSLGRNSATDEKILLLAQAISASPVEWSIWGWAAGSIANCIWMQRMLEGRDPNIVDDDDLGALGEIHHQVFEATQNLYEALRVVSQKFNP